RVRGAFASGAGGVDAHFPRVHYSPDVNSCEGGFLVTWHQGTSEFNNQVNYRIVAYPNQLVTPQRAIASAATKWEMGAAIAYSEASKVFLVAWKTARIETQTARVTARVMAARINLDGQVVGSVIQVSDPALHGRDPSVAWNPTANEFGVLYTGWDPPYVVFARV